MNNTKRAATVAAMAATVGIVLSAVPAQAATVTGWVGPAAGGRYLTTSTINNAPLVASSRIYSTFGQNAAPGDIGVRARLFKSGVLCEAIDYRYNPGPTADFSAETTGTCGTGSYNSHGFVAVWNATNFTYDQTVTFPSNPLDWTAPSTARVAGSDEQIQTGTNAEGKEFGSGDTTAETPDLIAAYTTDGQLGYVKQADLDGVAPENPAAAAALSATPRSVPVYATDGTTQLGTFQIG